jgi:hypothetical protein
MQNAPIVPNANCHPRGGREEVLTLAHLHLFVLAQHTTTQLEKEDTFSFVMSILNVQEHIAVGEMPRRHFKKA